MTTPAKELGYEEGDIFVVEGLIGETVFTKGSIIQFYHDDGSRIPLFKLIEGDCYFNHADGEPGAYLDLSLIRKIEGNLYRAVDDAFFPPFTVGSIVEFADEIADEDTSNVCLFVLVKGTCNYPEVYKEITGKETDLQGCFSAMNRLESFDIPTQETQDKGENTMKYLTPNEVRAILKDTGPNFFTVEFDKQDGSPRKMNARIGTSAGAKGGESTIAHKSNLISCKEMKGGKSQFRCFDVNRVRSIKAKGKVYTPSH